MTVSEGLKSKLDTFERSGELQLNINQKRELQDICREIFRFSIDINCGQCLGKYANKLLRYLKEKK